MFLVPTLFTLGGLEVLGLSTALFLGEVTIASLEILY